MSEDESEPTVWVLESSENGTPQSMGVERVFPTEDDLMDYLRDHRTTVRGTGSQAWRWGEYEVSGYEEVGDEWD